MSVPTAGSITSTHTTAQRPPARGNGKPPLRPPPTPMLRPEASAQLRDRLIAELSDIGTADAAALWAHRELRQKYTLTAADAERVEERFKARLASFAAPAAAEIAPLAAESAIAEVSKAIEQTSDAPLSAPMPHGKRKPSRSRTIDKSLLTLPEPRRVRDRDHVRHVARQSCLVCGRKPCDAHHLRFAQSRALGRKVSDEFTVPLCRGHHRELHRHGDEAAWWRKAAIDPSAAARSLWLETHPRLRAADR